MIQEKLLKELEERLDGIRSLRDEIQEDLLSVDMWVDKCLYSLDSLNDTLRSLKNGPKR